MLPSESLSMPAEWRVLLEQVAPAFARRSAHRLFMVLACGLILAGRGTVTGMAAAAGTGREWRRAREVLRLGEARHRRARPGGRQADREVPAQRVRPADRGGRRHLLPQAGPPRGGSTVGI